MWISDEALPSFNIVIAVMREDILPVDLGVRYDSWIQNCMRYIEEDFNNAIDINGKH